MKLNNNECPGVGRCREVVDAACRAALKQFADEVYRRLQSCKRFDSRQRTGTSGPLIDRWITENCLVQPGLWIGATAAFRAFREWFQEEHDCPSAMSVTAFGRAMACRFRKSKVNGCVRYHGVAIKINNAPGC